MGILYKVEFMSIRVLVSIESHDLHVTCFRLDVKMAANQSTPEIVTSSTDTEVSADPRLIVLGIGCNLLNIQC